MNRLFFGTKITYSPGSKFPGKCTPLPLGEVIEKLRNGFWQPYADTCASLPEDERQKWKADNAPLLVMAANLRYRNANPANLIEHSGLVCLDLDGVEDVVGLKMEIMALPYVVLICKSISGTGIFCVVHIPKCDADTHKRYYDALQNLFAKAFNTATTIDAAPKNIASARYVSYDPGLYVNYDPGIFDKLPPAPPPRPRPSAEYMSLNEDPTKRKVSRLVNEAISRGIDITSDYGNKTSGYNDWLCIGGTLAALFGETGRDYYHGLSSLSPGYSERETDMKFTDVLGKGFAPRVGAFINICKKYGLDISTHHNERDIPLARRQNTPARSQVANTPRIANAAPVVFDAKPIQWGAPLPAATLAPIRTHGARRPVLELAAITEALAFTKPAIPAAPPRRPNPPVPGANKYEYSQKDKESKFGALKSFFQHAHIPAGPVKMNRETTITDPALFIGGHLAMIEANNGKRVATPYMDRLQILKSKIESNVFQTNQRAAETCGI